MKKVFLLLSIIILANAACGLPFIAATPTAIPTLATPLLVLPTPLLPTTAPTEAPSTTPTTSPKATPAFDGTPASFGLLNLVIPTGLASGASGTQFPRAEGENVAPWEVTPGHTLLMLDEYLLQGKPHQPKVFVYPAQAYAEMRDGAAASLQTLKTVLSDPFTATSIDQLPLAPFSNDAQIYASQIKFLNFQNGQGVRFLTQAAQYAAPANNKDLFYQYQGLTSDGAYYVIAILPVSNPFLADSDARDAALPPNGIPYPDISDPNANFPLYYKSVTDVLGATPADDFTPSLNQLDALVQSIRITP